MADDLQFACRPCISLRRIWQCRQCTFIRSPGFVAFVSAPSFVHMDSLLSLLHRFAKRFSRQPRLTSCVQCCVMRLLTRSPLTSRGQCWYLCIQPALSPHPCTQCCRLNAAGHNNIPTLSEGCEGIVLSSDPTLSERCEGIVLSPIPRRLTMVYDTASVLRRISKSANASTVVWCGPLAGRMKYLSWCTQIPKLVSDWSDSDRSET